MDSKYKTLHLTYKPNLARHNILMIFYFSIQEYSLFRFQAYSNFLLIFSVMFLQLSSPSLALFWGAGDGGGRRWGGAHAVQQVSSEFPTRDWIRASALEVWSQPPDLPFISLKIISGLFMTICRTTRYKPCILPESSFLLIAELSE